MRLRPFFICLTGLDGSGKTTLSKGLVEALNRRGIKCKYVHARLNPLISRPFIFLGELIFLRDEDVSADYSKYSRRKRWAIDKHPFLSKIYQGILLLDCLVQSSLKVKLPLIFRRNIVCDRYIFDDIVCDLSVDMNYSKRKTIGLIKMLLVFLPKPDMMFLIDVSEEIAYHRKDDIYSIEHLRERRERFLEMGKEYKMLVVDGSRGQEELKWEMEQKVLTQVQR